MAPTASKILSADQFWELPEKPGLRLELVDGAAIETSGSTWLHAELVMHIFSLLREYVRDRNLGRTYADGLTYLLARDPDTLRIPDVSFIPRDRLPKEGPSASYVMVVPAIIIEVVSAGNTALELRRRTRDYIDAGVSLVWIVWPEDRTVSVYSGSMTPTELAADGVLDGGDVLPGFEVPVSDLFDIDW